MRLRVTFDLDYSVPADWDDHAVLFHVNESSMCRDNLLEEHLRQRERGGCCTCNSPDVTLVPDVFERALARLVKGSHGPS